MAETLKRPSNQNRLVNQPPLSNPIRGQSRYRVIVRRLSKPPTPYGWEIHDEERDLRIAQSKERYRTFREAWDAGSEALDGNWK